MIGARNLVNFDKFSKIGSIIYEIKCFQSSNYNFVSIPEIQDYLIAQFRDSRSVSELHELSLSIEPRERSIWLGEREEGERVMNLMAEKGFI